MTTRRDIITGIAALPVASMPNIANGSTSEAHQAASFADAIPSAQSDFLHDIDRQVLGEIETLERLLVSMKAHLRTANDPNPMIRYGALFDMRCGLGSACLAMDSLTENAEAQRLDAHEARLAEETRRQAEGLPHNPDFLKRYRTKEGT